MVRNPPGTFPTSPTISGGTKTEVMMLYDKRWEQPTETKRKRRTWRDILLRAADIIEQGGCAMGAMNLAANHRETVAHGIATARLHREINQCENPFTFWPWLFLSIPHQSVCPATDRQRNGCRDSAEPSAVWEIERLIHLAYT